MIEKICLTIAYLLATGLTCILFRSFRSGSPVFWFPIALAVMALGTIVLINPADPVEMKYVGLFFVALASFVVMAAAHLSFVRGGAALVQFRSRPEMKSPHTLKVLVAGVFVFSVVVTIAYYVIIGYNMVFLIFGGGGVEDYSTMRLNTYSGSDYFAPGYVNQFKNVLLPIATVSIMYWFWEARRKVELLAFSLFAVPFLVYALAGTGQRGYLFFTGVSIVLAFVLHNVGGRFRILSPRIIALAVPVLVLFGLMTISYYERGDQGLAQVAGDIVIRFTTIQQEGALVGFHYVDSLPIAWFTEWGKAFAGVLPGMEGSTMAHEVHAIMYGTARGTVPLSTVGSAYHNGGLIGVIMLFSLTGFFYAKLYTMFLNGEREIVRSLTFGFLFFYLIIYLVDSPAILLDNGVVTALLFLALIKTFRERAEKKFSSKSLPVGAH